MRALASLAALLLALPPAAAQPLDLALARQCFEEARQRCADDGGRLWGRDLLGPLLFADATSRTLVASVPDPQGLHLQPREGVFTGALPGDMFPANTALDWAGLRWTMLAWPPPRDAVPRAGLLLHELFHHVQDELGFPAENAVSAHLDTLEGRIGLQLEWRALAGALRAARRALAAERRGDEPARAAAAAARDAAIADALLFRRARRALLPDGAGAEHALEMNEGLAEYTGVKLRGTTDAQSLADLAERLPERAAALPAYARSFAYESGPAWGLLLDQVAEGWRGRLRRTDDLAELAGAATGSPAPGPPADLLAAARERALAHDGAALRAAEEAREQERLDALARWRALLVDGPVLELPLGPDMSYGFDPHEVLALEGLGSVYPSFTLVDAWGELQVDGGGALLADDRSRALVAAPAVPEPGPDRQLAGPGWHLRLQSGWKLVAGARPGDSRIARD